MASQNKDVLCTTCDSPLVLDGDEVAGDEVFCGYCGGVYKVMAVDVDSGEIEVEDDW